MSVAAAARQVGGHNTAGYYWVKKRRPAETRAAVRFAELKPRSAVSHTPVRRSLEVVVGEAAVRSKRVSMHSQRQLARTPTRITPPSHQPPSLN